MGEYKAKINGAGRSKAALFPMLQSAPTGLARMAAEAEQAGEGHLVEFRTMKVRSVLNRSVSKRQLSLAYSINPYRGCEFGCRYCYARYTHEFLEPAGGGGGTDFRDPETFERVIFLKEGAPWLLEQELKRIDPREEIALGTATDPYQPIERTAEITRGILKVFARKQGYRLGIVTKSRLILRDLDLLTEIARKNTLVIHLTVTTSDATLARVLEPRAPRPDLRLEAVRRLRKEGLTAGVLCSPLLPGITDSRQAIEEMAGHAAGVDASFFAAQPLFLKACSRPTYLSFVREHFPHLEADYAKRFGDRDFADKEYRERMARWVAMACWKHGLKQRSSDALLTRDVGSPRKIPAAVAGVEQVRLFA